MRRLIVKIAVFAAIVGFVFGPSAWRTAFEGPAPTLAMIEASQPAARSDTPVVAAFFYSGFCGACRIVEPRVSAARKDFAERAITFVTFDQTASLLTGDQLEALAQTHAMAETWARYRGSTGFVLLVDPSTDKVLEELTVRHSAEDMRAAIESALAREAG